jgi:hypothetical protein
MKILTAIVFAALTASSAALAGHVHKGHEDLAGNWLATFNLLSGASGCPIDVEIPARFDGGVLTGENGSGATLSAMIDAHKTIKGHFTSPEGFPDFRPFSRLNESNLNCGYSLFGPVMILSP